jgi:hypothetical protein
LFNFHTSQPVWEEIDNQHVDHFVLSRWLVNYAIMSHGIWYASTRHISSPEDRITSIKHCVPRISSKMATIDECIEFALKNIGLWWRYGISRHCDESKYIIIGFIICLAYLHNKRTCDSDAEDNKHGVTRRNFGWFRTFIIPRPYMKHKDNNLQIPITLLNLILRTKIKSEMMKSAVYAN